MRPVLRYQIKIKLQVRLKATIGIVGHESQSRSMEFDQRGNHEDVGR
jgi:hypothetical protein